MSEIEPVENKGCRQEVNYTLECGHVWTSWIFNDCIVRGLRAYNLEKVLAKSLVYK